MTASRLDDGAILSGADAEAEDVTLVHLYDVEGAAGDGRSLEGEPIAGVIRFDTETLKIMGIPTANLAGVKVRGDSMEGSLNDGDWVLINRGDQDVRQDGVFLLLVSGERRIKRVQRLAGGALYLISDNDRYQPEMIRPQDMHDVRVLGRCVVRIGPIA
ncbi:S24 family peptidase [Modicisalibacter sp. MOD 31.J]|uniref:S24 family peptidase n=1 Tax=Modicisalibacter sp. MOD 31.J TaxID=2831897 RepID=UPI001CCB358D|nr:S24 family peptidase [Modicisalibacter sp. MOD 31.J]MBZ9576747.1 S24 family peptidase [Modicisalibacter sp. MOD 31.J]